MRSLGSGAWMVAVCAAVLLGACSPDTPEPAPGPDSSSVSTTPATPTSEAPTTTAPEPPALPPEATSPDAAGAAAFVRHWFDLVNYAYATGDTAPMSTAATADCEVCMELQDKVAAMHANGQHVEGSAITVSGAEAPPPDPDGLVIVATTYESGAFDLVDGNGSRRPQVAGPTITAGAVLEFRDGGWLLVGLGS